MLSGATKFTFRAVERRSFATSGIGFGERWGLTASRGLTLSLLSRTIGLTLTLVVAVIALATAVGVSKILED